MRGSVGLLLAEDPVAGFCQMPGDGDDGAAMPSLRKQPLVQTSHVRLTMGFEPYGTIRRFDKSPFQILVDETRDASEAGVTSAGEYSWHQSRVTGQILSAWEATHVADLQPDEDNDVRSMLVGPDLLA